MLTILDLDDDCLMNIFKYLTIYELIEAEKVCTGFKVACEQVYYTKKFHKLRLELRYLKLEHFRNIFERAGPALRKFEFSGGYLMDPKIKKILIEGVTEMSPQLSNLSINYIQMTKEEYQDLQQCFQYLNSLDLSHCSLDESLGKLNGDELKEIKHLKLFGNSFSGSFFKDMKHVQVLEVGMCFHLNFEEFVEFLKNCINLVELNLTGCCQLVTAEKNILDDILIHQPNIEKLIFDMAGPVKDFDFMSNFKKLKHYSFNGRRLGT